MKLTNERIRHLRIYHGMSLKEFAARIGTSFVTVHRIERGELKVSDSMRARIIDAFALDAYKLRTASKHYRNNIEPFEGEERQKAVREELEAAGDE